MSKRNALPASPLSGWTDEEKVHHAVVVVAREMSRDGATFDARYAARQEARAALARLNASLAKRGARCGYTL